MPENKRKSCKSEQEPIEVISQNEITVGAMRWRAIKEERSLGNRKISEMLEGMSPGLVSDYLSGRKRPMGEQRVKICRVFGIDSADFDRVWVPEPVDSSSAADDLPPEARRAIESPEEPTALELLRSTLKAVNERLATPGLTIQDQARLLSTSVQIINGIGRATGEMDQSDMQRFRQSVEYRSFCRRVISAVADCERCRESMLRVLGVAGADARAMSLVGPLRLSALAEECGHVETHDSVDDLAPAIDGLQYPISERERELVKLDRDLAKRCLAALELGHPIITESRVAYPPADDHREIVMKTLRSEIDREERFVAFERDFGRVAGERARDLS